MLPLISLIVTGWHRISATASTFHRTNVMIFHIYSWVIIVSFLSAQAKCQKINVTMCVLYERNTVGLLYDFNRVQAALDMALDYVNEAIVAPEMYVAAVYRDIGPYCTDPGLTSAARQALYLNDQGINCDVYLGPGCGSAAEPLYDITAAWDKAIIGLPSASVGMKASPYYYKRLTRMSFTYPTFNIVIVRFLSYFNYTTPTFLYDDQDNFYAESGALIEKSLIQNYSQLYRTSKFAPFGAVMYQSKEIMIRQLLDNASKTSRVLFILANAATTRSFMLIAHQLGMTSGEYVFVAVELFDSALWGPFTWQNNDANDKAALKAFRALLIISLDINNKNDADTDNLRKFWDDVTELSQRKFNYTFPSLERERVDPIVAHFYEAVLFYGTNVYAMYQQNQSYQSGIDFTDFVGEKEYQSPLTSAYYLDENSERRSPYIIKSFDRRTHKHVVFLQLSARTGDLTPIGAITFLGRPGMPPNEPRCGFRDENPVCLAERSALPQGTVESAITVPAIVFVLLCAVGVYAIKRALSDDADPLWWRIILQDIDISATNTNAKSSYRSALRSTTASNPSIHKEIGLPEKNTDDQEQEEIPLIRTGLLAGVSVTLIALPQPKHRVPGDIRNAAAMARTLIHRNIQKFIGVAVNEDNQCDSIVGELCQKGTLRDLVNDPSINLDWEFQSAIMKDLVNGMMYLHMSNLRSHGHLNDQSCLIDNRFILKICEYGFPSLRNENDLQPLSSANENRNYNILLWRAPELLRKPMPPSGTQAGDIYSFGILLQRVILRSAPYHIGEGGLVKKKKKADREEVSDKDIVQDVRRGLVPPLRPAVPLSTCPSSLYELMTICWDEEPTVRPPFARIRPIIARVVGSAGENIVDYLIKRMEQYAAGLEYEVEMKMKQFMEERQRSAAVLAHLLPKSVTDALGRGIPIIPETYDHTTVYFGDVPGFAEAIEECDSALETVELLNRLYSTCDAVVAMYDVYKVETVHDSYLIASGVPVRNGSKHAEQIATMALGIRREISNLRSTMDKAKKFKLRAGLHSGSCVAGVIGLKMPRYCLFGDTVNTASRMESHGEAGKIHISESTKLILDKYEDFIVAERGIIDIKGKGSMLTYWLVGRN